MPNLIPIVSFNGSLGEVKLVCDRSSGALYAVYTQTPVPQQQRIEFVRSTDGGLSWSAPEVLSSFRGNTPHMAMGPDGELYVIWEDHVQAAIVGRKSADSGVSFGAEFRVSSIQENLGFGPPDWEANTFRFSRLAHMPCLDFPAFLGFAVDVSSGPRRGALYVTWTEHGLGTAEMAPRRVLKEVEPNSGYFANFMPIEIGDDVFGFMGSQDEPPFTGDCDFFTFEGTAGTTIQITGGATECQTQGGCQELSMNFDLFCGSDTTALTRVGCSQLYGSAPIPPMIYTLPTTGRYYLITGCSSNGNISYQLRLREYVIDPNQVARDHRDVVLVSSTDGGATWSEKVRVNDDAPLHDNAIPAVAVDGQGLVHVAWYDRREQPECGGRVQTYWTWSADGGATFEPSRPVSEEPSQSGRFTGFSQFGTWRVGDHMALHADGDRVHLLWTQVPIGGGGEIYGVVITDMPTSVLVPRFTAEAAGARVVLRWEVSDGQDVVGFRLHRAADAEDAFVRIAEVAVSGVRAYVWEDASVGAGRRYRYRLEVVRAESPSLWEGPIEIAVASRSAVLRWRDAVPNPFDDVIEMGLEGPSLGGTRVRVFDVAGHVVAELRAEVRAGEVSVRWDGRNLAGRPVSPGVYLVRAEAGGRHATRRVIRMR